MPANVEVDYLKAEEKYREAKTTEEKIKALQLMLSLAPTHKGAEKLRANIKQRLSQLRKEQQYKKKKFKSKGIKKEGAGQIVLIGFPNSGKSYFLNKFTNVNTLSTQLPFETTKPVIAMLDYKGAKIQLIEIPSLVENYVEAKEGPYNLSLIKESDGILAFYSNNLEKEKIKNEMIKSKIILGVKKPNIKIEKKTFGGLEIIGKNHLKFPLNKLKDYLLKKRHHNLKIEIFEDVNFEKIKLLLEGYFFKDVLFIKKGEYSENLKQKIWKMLNKIMIYTKEPGKKAVNKPLILQKGATVRDAAKEIHKDFVNKFKYAKVWGNNVKFDGQKVGLNYKLNDGDIIEIHIR